MIPALSVRGGRLVCWLFVLAIVGSGTVIWWTSDPETLADLLKKTKAIGKLGPQTALGSMGYIIEPQNVQFEFVNPKQKAGPPETIVEANNKRYLELMKKPITEPKDYDMDSIRPPQDIATYKHANATILSLVRNAEARAIGLSIKRFERAFNSKFKYPYTFINDQPFSDKFKDTMRKYTDAPLNFVVVAPELWDRPGFIDSKRASKAMKVLASKSVAYATKDSYHNMCRFYAGNFYNVPELQNFKYYWRLEPHVDFYNVIKYDVFKYLEGTGKIYGFNLNLYDIHESVETLWPETLKFLNTGDNYKYVNENGAFQWILEDQQHPEKNQATGGYSTCHFWSNFEIADMDFFRSEAYNNYFKHLDAAGGFYYERWGDAPVHSLGLSLFADKSKIHWFRDIGYFHDPYYNCPNSDQTTQAKCVVGKFSKWEHLADQNCMASWIDYAMGDEQINVY